MPTVNVLYFAQVRDRCGRDSDQLELPELITPDILLAAVIAQHPTHEKLLRHCRVAVNHSFITTAVTISENSEIALIPPVSGG